MDSPCELSREARLADARLSGDERGLGRALERALPRRGQRLALVDPADERQRLARRQRRRQRRRHRGAGVPRDLVGDHLAQPLQLEGAGRFEAMAATRAGKEANDLAREDLPLARRVAQPGGFDDRRAEAVVALPRHVTRTDPDAHAERCRKVAVEPADRALDGDGTRDRLRGRGEHDHVSRRPCPSPPRRGAPRRRRGSRRRGGGAARRRGRHRAGGGSRSTLRGR